MRCRLGDYAWIIASGIEENVGIMVEVVGEGREFQGTRWDWIIMSKGGKIKSSTGPGANVAFCMDWQLIPLRPNGEDVAKKRGLKIT